MQFLSAASAWFALSLPAIVLMYILKKQYENFSVPSHLLWRRVLREQEANRPWQKLRSRLLLLLQLLAALLIVLTLMQPALPSSAAEGEHAVLLIDRSGSMTARLVRSADAADQVGDTRLEQAVFEANAWLDGQPAGKVVSLVTNGAEPVVLASRERDKEVVKSRLRELLPYYGRSDNTAALSLADSLHQGSSDGVTILYTDGNWPDAAEASELALHARAEIAVIGAPIDNAGILSFGIKEDSSRAGYNRAVVTVRNDSASQRDINVILYAYQDGGTRETAAELTLRAAAGSWQSGEAQGLPPAAYYKAELRHSGDGIAADDAAYGFPAVKGDRKALLVTEGNLFLEKALLLAGVQPVKIAPSAAAPSGSQLSDIHWVLLDGTLDDVKDRDGWKELLANKPLWVIDHPAAGGAATRLPTSVAVQVEDHPVTAYISFQDTHIGRFATPESADVAWGKPVLVYGGVPAIYAGSGQGRSQLRFTFKLQDTDLPLRPEFPVLIVQAVEWMNGGDGEQLGVATAGGRIELPLEAETARAEWDPVEGAATGIASERLLLTTPQPVEAYGGDAYAAPSLPGLYRLIERNNDGGTIRSRYLAVVPDYGELAPASTERVLQFKAAGGDGQDGAGDSGPDRSIDEMLASQPLLAAAALLLLALMATEWEVYRRGHSS